MQRRPSHPHGQLTGMIVLICLMASVGIMFWMPSVGPRPSFDPVAAQAAGTPTLPMDRPTRTPRPDMNAPVAQEAPVPTMDWSTVPTAIPADQLVPPTAEPQVAPIIAQAQPGVIYVEQPPDNTALAAAQQAAADAQAQADAAQALIRDQQAALDAQSAAAAKALQDADARHQAELAAAQPSMVNPNDFAAPDPKATCQFTGCLHQP